jgi:hypothetical protein
LNAGGCRPCAHSDLEACRPFRPRSPLLRADDLDLTPSAEGKVLGRVAPNSLFGVRRSLERRLPWAPVGRARLAALERLEHPQYFPSSGPSTGRSRRATESFSPGQRGRLPVEESSQSDPEPRAPRRAPCDSLPASGIGDGEGSGSLVSRARSQGSGRSNSTKSVRHIKNRRRPRGRCRRPSPSRAGNRYAPAIATLSSGEDP